MIEVSEARRDAPTEYKNALQERVYRVLGELGIPFERVDTGEAVTMEDCAAINERLDMTMVKTLFLRNRQGTAFFLFVTAGDKPFSACAFGAAMGVARVSFAAPEQMEAMLGTRVGAATVFSALLESAREVRIVIDREVAEAEWYGCSDGTTTGYMKLRTVDVLSRLLSYAGREATVVGVERKDGAA